MGGRAKARANVDLQGGLREMRVAKVTLVMVAAVNNRYLARDIEREWIMMARLSRGTGPWHPSWRPARAEHRSRRDGDEAVDGARRTTPRAHDAQVEQDGVLSRARAELFRRSIADRDQLGDEGAPTHRGWQPTFDPEQHAVGAHPNRLGAALVVER